ncbi:hypothetical protein [Ramlibacter pallidus]|uniref:Uncharacterized protein n=1 Tax=Ramlibacter pallidus TaxID=2780087 RepID=A0ABR9S4A7_9BURK|nr:hypothetical protein [Ramlibacter pallidus]MBE7368311.1 hypothetical protein [Ramlibacter pallidus]
MRWFNTKDLRSSIYAIFSVGVSRPAASDHSLRTENIRQTMLAMVDMDGSDRAEKLARRIRYADLEALWFMRGELMGLLARTHGEMAAREQLEGLGALFEDMLPSGLRSRPSPLNHSYRASRPHSDDI